MAKIIIEGFDSIEQAREFYSWFEGAGEQHADEWFQCQDAGRSPMTDMKKPPVVDGDTFTFHVHTP